MYKLVVLLSVAALAVGKPGVGVVPVAYSSVVPGVSSLSQYSSSVVHGAPLATAYSAQVNAAPAVLPYAALVQLPHAPAVVLDAVHGVPLDTPEVVAARAAHFQAKALAGHHLKKRSVAVAPVAYSGLVVSPYSARLVSAYAAPVVSAYSSSVVSPYSTYSAYSRPVAASPLAYHGVVPKALSVHPW